MYKDTNGSEIKKYEQPQKAKIGRYVWTDKNGRKIYGEWGSVTTDKIEVPEVSGYRADKTEVPSVTLSSPEDVFEDDKFREKFRDDIYPVLTPIMIGGNKEIPKFDDKDINFFIELHDPDEDDQHVYCFLQIPHQIGRIIRVKSKYYYIEDFVRANFSHMFNAKIIDRYVMFRVNKQYNSSIDHDVSIPIVNRVNNVISKRDENNIVFLDIMMYDEENDEMFNLIKVLRKLLKVPKKHIFIIMREDQNTLGLHYLKSYPFHKAFKGVIEENITENNWKKKFKPKSDFGLVKGQSLFDYLDDDDMIVHHPYESYDIVVKFLKEAAMDPKVISIKQTLYRVSSKKSPIVQALCAAAENGKKVTVMLELLARFDEKQNISLINKLKKSGCNIVYSLEGLKTHCKMCIVTRVAKKGIVVYSHMGTGNYNELSAHIYTDISYFTSKKTIGHDLSSLFNMITGFSRHYTLQSLSYSPDTLRQTICDEIERCANSDKPSIIDLKLNALSDKKMVAVIQAAAKNKNVTVNIICRGVCSLTPTDNIHIKSVVGRFLEHSRIYSFTYDDNTNVYISSADLLTRNLDRRIELLIPINDTVCKEKVLFILHKLQSDTANSFVMNSDGSYEYNPGDNYINSQNEFIMD